MAKPPPAAKPRQTNRKSSKQKLSVYLEPDLLDQLLHHAARTGNSRSMIAGAAITSFLSPDAAEQREAATAKRLDQIDRRMARLERDLTISIEANAIFVRSWLVTTPNLPDATARATRAQANQRYNDFVTALGRRLSKGPKLRQEISEDVARREAGRQG